MLRSTRTKSRRRCGGKSAAGVRQRCRVGVVTPYLLVGGGRPEQEAPAGNNPVVRDDHCGDSSRQDTLLVSVEAPKQHQWYEADGVTVRPIRSPPEAEMEAFFAAAELAERRRFAERYNYDVDLDRPLEGRFEWAPVNT